LSQQIKYTHKELVRAVERIQEMKGFDKEVDASRVAGQILNEALDSMEKTVYKNVKDMSGKDEVVEDGFGGEEFGL